MDTTPTTDQIIAAADALYDESVELLSELVRHPSTLGNEASAQNYIAEVFADLGLMVDKFEIDINTIKDEQGFSPVDWSYKGKENVVAIHQPQRNTGRSLIFNGHMDVVPEGPADMWTDGPYEPVVRDGRLYGRGGGDMKAGIVSYTMAFKALQNMGLQPAAPVYLQSVIEEECTGNGALACLTRGYKADAAIIPEPFEQSLMIGQMGVMWFRVLVRGKPAHVLDTSAGINAIEAAFELVQALKALEEQWNDDEVRHESYEGAKHPVNFNLGVIQGGEWPSSVPTECSFKMRVGFFPGIKPAEIREVVLKTINEAAQNNPGMTKTPPVVEFIGFQAEGCTIDPEEAMMQMMADVHTRVTGRDPVFRSTTATTDARFFNLYGNIPATCYGPEADSIHGIDESVGLESFKEVTRVLAVFLAEWCGTEPLIRKA
jgi:acetylornithine deacetylase